jgi:biofilm protein TabA
MILDKLARGRRYRSLHPGLARAFEFLAGTDAQALAPGRHDIDGDRLYVTVDQTTGTGHDGARLEVHRKYIDIQVTIDGTDEIGWMALGDCRNPSGPFLADKDVGFFHDRPLTWIAVPAGQFALFFPDDAHAPLAGKGPLKKAIVKVLV